MNDPNHSSGLRPQTLHQGQEHLKAPGVWKFELLAEPVTTAGIVGWPGLYIIDICEVYTRQHSDSNLREDGVLQPFPSRHLFTTWQSARTPMNMTFLLIGELRPKAAATVSVNSMERRDHA